jgi:Autophagocytosis associated protein, active-site domain
MPPRSSSGGFLTHGVLNPDEFVASGDFLVHACPTWHWVAGQKQSAKSYLPADKQFLITRNVPCYRRPAALERAVNLDIDGIEGTPRPRRDWESCQRSLVLSLEASFVSSLALTRNTHSMYGCCVAPPQAARTTTGWRRRWSEKHQPRLKMTCRTSRTCLQARHYMRLRCHLVCKQMPRTRASCCLLLATSCGRAAMM